MGRFSEQDARRAWTRLSAWYRMWAEFDAGRGNTPGHQATPANALDALGEVGVVRQMLDLAELGAVTAARRAGASWTDVGVSLGVSKQTAWEKWREVDSK